ncbi:MAG: EAL domain-containing protein [Kangiellaceae bacterium]|jgi:diguanylate cyclase (GGDEF)-like protein|nr:EAL domain-containing protein [Kangiellaceae bacterium]
MAFFRKNIWIAFYLITIISTFVLIYSLLRAEATIRTKFKEELSSYSLLFNQTMDAQFKQTELLIDLLGNQLSQSSIDGDKLQRAMKDLLAVTPSLAGFGLVGLDGEYIITSANLNPVGIQNLNSNPDTAASFKRTLAQRKMVIGRTYFFKAINSWVIPLRKTIYDVKDQPIAVMTTGFILTERGFMSGLNNLSDRRANLYNTNNQHQIYVSGDFARDYPNLVYDVVAEQSSIPYVDIASSDKPRNLEFEFYNRRTDDSELAIAVYNDRYDYWAITAQSYRYVSNSFYTQAAIYTVTYLLVVGALYWLFRTISRSEAKIKEKLAYQANHDSLTQLYNRNYLNFMVRHRQDHLPSHFSLVFVDLDHFKNINDNFGHNIGDAILREVSLRLNNFISEYDTLFRFGGDEFLIITDTDESALEHYGNEVIKLLTETIHVNQLQFVVGASVGCATYGKDTSDFNELLSMADAAMFEAKKQRNKVEIYAARIKSKLARKAQLEQCLRQAVERNEIKMNYQPQIDSHGDLHGVESLARWDCAELGPVSPVEFIEVAEEIGLMPELGRFIIRRSLQEMGELQRKLRRDFKVSINVSVKQFIEVSFGSFLLNEIDKAGLANVGVKIEVTESLFAEELNYILTILKALKTKGVSIALDDFGTGYSSLSMLRQLPIDELKIDRSFVDAMIKKDENRELVKVIIELAQTFGMYTLAEGVETAEQRDMLAGFGCSFYQGFYYSKPLPVSMLEKYIVMNQV